MRTQTPPLAPGKHGDDGTIYIVLNDFGPLGQAYVETDAEEADEPAVVSKILHGEYSNPERVVAFNTAKEWSRDVTREIALRLLDLNQDGVALSAVAREFVERVTGQSVRVAV
jgi:hypothetical protein